LSTSTVLLVGHGYLGSATAPLLASRGWEVVAVNRQESSPAPEGYRILVGDVADADSAAGFADHFPSLPSAIIHCASSGRGGAEAYRSVFLEGVRNLIRHFPGVPVFFTSSTSVYGQTDGSTVVEESPVEPERETSRLLLETETLVRASGGTVLRLAGIYGPKRSVYLQRLFDGTATIETGGVSRFLNQVHRDDAAGALAHLLSLPSARVSGRVFNVVDDHVCTQRELYEGLCARFGLPLPPEAPPATERKRAWTHKRVSNAALHTTGWAPLYPSFFDAVERDPEFVASMRGSSPEPGGG